MFGAVLMIIIGVARGIAQAEEPTENNEAKRNTSSATQQQKFIAQPGNEKITGRDSSHQSHLTATKTSEKVVIDSIHVVEELTVQQVNISCLVRGYPTPTIFWSKKSFGGGTEQSLNSKSANYLIFNATYADSGIYTCKADNGITSDSKSTDVVVVQLQVGDSQSKSVMNSP